MKKLICKVICAALLALAVVLPVNAVYKNKTQGEDGTAKFRDVPNGITISNCGSSHGGDFVYSDLEGYVCFNFALSSQSLTYDYRILSYYEDRLAEGGIMFIPISYFSLLGIDETERESFESINKRYYKFLPKEYIKEYNLQTDFLVEKFPALSAYEELFLKLMEPDQEQSETNITPEDHADYVKQSAQAATDRHLNIMKPDGELIINNAEIDAVHQIIALCKRKNITPVLITTPFSKEYNDAIESSVPDFRKEILENLMEEISISEKVAYYDYSHDERFYQNYDWFMDADHLNVDGGRAFVDIVMKEIVETLL